MTIEGIIDTLVVEFENTTKRSIDVTNKNRRGESLFIAGLRQNTAKQLKQNRLHITR
jgi:hypothetical protein